MRVLLADDHNLFREGLKLIFDKLDPGTRVVEAATYEGAVQVAGAEGPFDLVLLDLKMPGMRGIAGVAAFLEVFPDLPVAILSGAFERDDVLAAIDAGARGFLPKTLTSEGMLSALRLVLSGETYVPSLVYFGRTPARDPLPDGAPAETAKVRQLTAREREILVLLVAGNSNKGIGNQLDITEPTVRSHLKNIYRKLGVKNRAHAVGMALRSGLVA